MHVPDGFFTVPVSAACGAVAVAGIAACLRGARRELDERTTPMAGLTAAFVFAVQMLNFPVAVGTSGHLLGGALAAILVGPWTGAVCLAVVLLVQALGFADGGLTAYGINVVLMSLTTTVVGYAVFVALRAVLPRTRGGAMAASFGGALVSVPAAALVFVLLYAVGGTTEVPLAALTAAMVGWHVLIGLGEAAITAAVVGSVLASRPDLVYGARDLQVTPELRVRDVVRV